MVSKIPVLKIADSSYKSLYMLSAAAASIAAVLTIAEVIILAFYSPPGNISDWFMLFQSNRIIAFLDFWGLEGPLYMMFAIVFLGLYAVLRKVDEGLIAIATTSALLGIGIFLATNNPFAMLSLSNQYTAAATEVERLSLLGAGQALLANTGQRAVGGFNIGLFLLSIAGLIVSLVMARSAVFGRKTAVVGILANVLSLADYLRQALTSSVIIALLVILPNALFLVVWYGLVSHKLYIHGCTTGKMLRIQSSSEASNKLG